MTSPETIPASADRSPYRVLVWWDVDMYIGAYKRRKLTARPLRNLERILGHRVHVEGRSVYPQMPDGVWKIEAFNYLDIANPAIAAAFVLGQISALSEWFSGFGYKPVSTTTGDLDDATICTFYWHDYEQIKKYRHIQSGGVLLALVENFPILKDRHSRYDFMQFQRPRPTIGIDHGKTPRSNFHITITIKFLCNDRQKLTQYHWPKLMEKYGLSDPDRVEFGPQPKNGEPNQISVVKSLADALEHDAIAYCLARTERCRFKLGGTDEEVFRAERHPDQGPFDGMFSISLKRMA